MLKLQVGLDLLRLALDCVFKIDYLHLGPVEINLRGIRQLILSDPSLAKVLDQSQYLVFVHSGIGVPI